MLIERQSALTGKWHTRDIPCTDAQLEAWRNGSLIQNAMPELSIDDREFIISGSTPEEWTEVFG